MTDTVTAFSLHWAPNYERQWPEPGLKSPDHYDFSKEKLDFSIYCICQLLALLGKFWATCHMQFKNLTGSAHICSESPSLTGKSIIMAETKKQVSKQHFMLSLSVWKWLMNRVLNLNSALVYDKGLHVCVLSCLFMSDSLWLYGLAHQSPLSMEFSRKEYWSRLPFLPQGDLPDPGVEPLSPALAGRSLPLQHLLLLTNCKEERKIRENSLWKPP